MMYICLQQWSREVNYFLSAMGCNYYLDYRQCHEDPEESNYNDFVNMDATRRVRVILYYVVKGFTLTTMLNNFQAIHVGDVPFGGQSGDVYSALTEDIMKSQRFNVEFLLDRYRVTICFTFLAIIVMNS